MYQIDRYFDEHCMCYIYEVTNPDNKVILTTPYLDECYGIIGDNEYEETWSEN